MKPVIKIAVFLLLIVILDRIIGYSFQYCSLKYHFDNRIGLLLDDKLDKDIMILGSSRALNGIDPETIQKETNLSCFNMGYSGSNVEFQESILDLILSREKKPTYIIFNLDDPGTLMDFGGLVIYKTEELVPYVYNDMINRKVCERLGKSYLATQFSSTFLQNVNSVNTIKYLFEGKEKPAYQINNIDSNGANLMDGHQAGFEHMVFKKQILIYSKEKEFEPYLQSFQRILTKSKASGIKLMLVISPSFFSKNIGFKERIDELVGNDVEVFDYSAIFSDSELFYNYGHLNKKGAIAFAKVVAQDLKKLK